MRKWLFGGLGLLLVLCGGGVAVITWALSRTSINTIGKVSFDRALKIPPLAESAVDGQGRRVFELKAQAGESDLGHGATRTWGYNGAYLGPTLRAERGEQVVVNIHNGLAEPTTVHWHGMHLPAQADGGPHRPIAAGGGTFQAAWKLDQPAATLWYHPHPSERTEAQVYRGLAGMFIVDDPATDSTQLPREYGVDDVPVVVQDKAFDGSQLSMDDRFGSDIGVLGDQLLVNGTPGPYLDVQTERVRLRLLNGSTARVYNFTLEGGRQFAMVGSDGGLLARPYMTDHLRLSVGERAEIVVALKPGERVALRSERPLPDFDFGNRKLQGGEDSFDVLQLRAAQTLRKSPELPAALVDTPRLDPKQAAAKRDFTFSGRDINGEGMDMDRVDAVVVKNTTEVWNVKNGHDTPHSFHIHDVQFQVLSVDGAAPPEPLGGWKDTLFLEPHRRYSVIARFADYADPTTAYMFHCHVLRHEDEGMMGQFVVVEKKGDQPRLRHG
ncbi:multicopper oxidase domain-containing protein [Dactylosporangium sp. AC04546]|uniref:multicopper oxidase family protein n=1 Tax=Dactylosporangium sp. AC04546 TaxID=2862460 RepID=UPI001EE06C0F|nr:multicopper oxidase domain-containing protein [Dactylosporangium sp. AC04546]WVK84989.1 multicopper oxidase domain-containing protein [Dactylosporangium sp. AC04546]